MTIVEEQRLHQSPFAKSCAVLVSVGTELPALERQCRDAYRESRADGYSTSSALDGGSPSSIVDENGEPMPPLSDPVGELVVSQTPESNQAGRALYRARSLMRDAEKAAEQARAILIAAITPPVELEPEPDATMWCQVCVAVTKKEGTKTTKVLSPTHRIRAYGNEPARARCWDCDGWALMAAQDPMYPRERPKSLILLQAEGRRITTKAVEDAIAGFRATA